MGVNFYTTARSGEKLQLQKRSCWRDSQGKEGRI
jgi:hypothetical protein